MASIPDTMSTNTSIRMEAWVEAQSQHMGNDVLNQFLRAEVEAAQDLGYQPWEDWSNDRRVFEIAWTRF